MRNYEVNYGGEVVALPKYNFKIAEKLEKQDSINAGNTRFRDKCKSMYELEKELLGADFVDRVIGNFEDADPNEINIVYIQIVRTYNDVLSEYTSQDISDKIETSKVDKVVELVNALDKANTMRFTR